jgi:chromosome segregation ATPase
MPFLELLLQHKEFIVILILLIGIGAGFSYVKVLNAQMETLKTQNATLESNLETSNNSIKTLQTSLDTQNKAVDDLKTAADQRVQAHATEIAAANAKADTYRQQALDILRLKPTNPDQCKAANDLINSEILKNAKK